MCLDLYLCANTYFFVRVPTKKYPILREPTVPRKLSFQLRLRRNRTPPYAVMLFSINIRGGDRTRNLPIRSRTRYPFRHTDCRGLRPPTTPQLQKTVWLHLFKGGKGPTETRTRITGVKTLCDNRLHYQTEKKPPIPLVEEMGAWRISPTKF